MAPDDLANPRGWNPSAAVARNRFIELLARGDDSIDVAEAALCIAGEHTSVDNPECLAQLSALAERARPGLEEIAANPLAERVDRLNRHLFTQEGFRGCAQEDYYEPRNSFLNEVLRRRRGIPIALSIVYVDVARRLGFRSSGIGFPGHFLAKIEPPERGRDATSGSDDSGATDEGGLGGAIVVDPFLGQCLDRAECETRLKRALGSEARFDPHWLRAASPREILVRVLGNLKHNYLSQKNWEAALACCERSLLLVPDAPIELRDRGILFQQLGCHSAAADDLERFLELAPDHESASAVLESLVALRARSNTLH